MISKTHHCMIDGISAVDLASVLLSPSPDGAIAEAQPWQPEAVPSRGQLVIEEARRRFAAPFEFGKAVVDAMQNPTETAQNIGEQISAVTETLGAGLFPASESPFNQPIGPHRRFEWMAIELADVKRVKNALGGTVNDVVLATVAGAVGSFLRGRGFRPQKLAELDFRALVPVSLRTSSQHGTLGNQIASWAARLPIAETDPRRRLRAGSRSHRRAQTVAPGDGRGGARASQRMDGAHAVVARDASGVARPLVQLDRNQRAGTADSALYDRLADDRPHIRWGRCSWIRRSTSRCSATMANCIGD